MNSLPTLRQLYYLVTVIKTRHFGRAAEQCFVTQSTLSTGIQELETQLGVLLMERSSRQVIPTRLGRELAQRAEQILALTDDLVQMAHAEMHPLSGQIRMGVIPTISPFLLPKALPLVRQACPGLELVLKEEMSSTLLERLRRGEIDVAVLAFPYETQGLKHAVFAAEPYWVALPPDHALLECKTIRSEQIPEHELLLLAEGHCLREHALNVCQLPVSRQRASIQGTSLYTLIEMVASGMGLTLLPDMAVHSAMIAQTQIGLRPLAGDHGVVPKRELGLVWRPSFPRAQLIEQLSALFARALVS